MPQLSPAMGISIYMTLTFIMMFFLMVSSVKLKSPLVYPSSRSNMVTFPLKVKEKKQMEYY